MVAAAAPAPSVVAPLVEQRSAERAETARVDAGPDGHAGVLVLRARIDAVLRDVLETHRMELDNGVTADDLEACDHMSITMVMDNSVAVTCGDSRGNEGGWNQILSGRLFLFHAKAVRQ